MTSNESLAVALLVVLVVVLIAAAATKRGRREMIRLMADVGLARTGPPPPPSRAALNRHLDSIRGRPPGGYGQPPHGAIPYGPANHHYNAGGLAPEHIAEAEREQWAAAHEAGSTGHYNTELAHDPNADVMQYHTPQPGIDYDGYITDLVADPRTKANHGQWVDSMRPWSGTAKTVDDMDEALEAGLHFHGLRRPQAIVQSNFPQQTEVGTHHLAKNNKFNFNNAPTYQFS